MSKTHRGRANFAQASLEGTGNGHEPALEAAPSVEVIKDSVDERFFRMADAAPVLIWMSGTDKLCTWFNQRWLDFVGRTMDQELGDGWVENVHTEDFQDCMQTYVSAYDAREPFTMEYRLKRRDGQFRWVLDNGTPMYDADRSFTGYIGSCIDITERKETEAALQAKEVELELIAQSTPLILTRCSRQLKYLFVNRAAAALFGCEPSELVGRSIVDVMGEAAFAKILPHIETVLSGQVAEFELEMNYSAAGVRWVQVNYIPEFDRHGVVVGWLASIVDTTERVLAERALRENERRFREMIDALPMTVYTTDAKGLITHYNPATVEFCGRRAGGEL